MIPTFNPWKRIDNEYDSKITTLYDTRRDRIAMTHMYHHLYRQCLLNNRNSLEMHESKVNVTNWRLYIILKYNIVTNITEHYLNHPTTNYMAGTYSFYKV